ncbi:hypothetical protein QZH41_009099 [Actinostola sp. cb2023]|nr:hypothetical protein QZH41_009099 [Actinostola sp. cb2023]
MVWHEVGKYGVHHGRTVRAPLKNSRYSAAKKAGYVFKTIANEKDGYDLDKSKRHLQKFSISDGFDSDFVVSEVERRRFSWNSWEFGGAYRTDDVLLSLNKKKRWLLPSLVEDKITEENERFGRDELRPRIALIERQSMNDEEYMGSQRLKKGDCCRVLDNQGTPMKRQSKRRKFCQVKDIYKRGDGPEIYYEVSTTGPSNQWPFCKETNHSRRAIVNFDYYSFSNVKSKPKQTAKDRIIDMCDDNDDYDDDDSEEEEEGEVSCVKEVDSNMFDIGAHIYTIITNQRQPSRSQRRKHQSGKLKSDEKLTNNNNTAASQQMKCYGKGCYMLIECQDTKDQSKEALTNPPALKFKSTDCDTTSTLSQSVKLCMSKTSLQSEFLHEKFGSRYAEGHSVPRKFSITAPHCQHQCLLFEPENGDNSGSSESTAVLVTLVCDNREDSYPSNSGLSNANNCTYRLTQLASESRCFDVNEVDILDCSCCKSILHDSFTSEKTSIKLRKTVIPFNVLNSFTGYNTEVHPLRTAHQEMDAVCRMSLGQTHSNTSVKKSMLAEVCCEICYREGEEPSITKGFTSLHACNHWFCDDCWNSYISSQIEQGKTCLICPAYECTTPVDDPTILSLAPNSYFKCWGIRRDNALQMSKDWNWCPGDQCKLVAKLTSNSIAGYPKAKSSTPSMCTGCGQSWCFGCQEDVHWPATCQQAQKFRDRTKSFFQLSSVSSGDDSYITSISVKRCPRCQYPIEKDGGCPHMMCSKCQFDFCWICGGAFDVFDGCDCDVNSGSKTEEILLVDEIGNKRFNKHLTVLVFHRTSRNIESLVKMYKHVETVQNAVSSYCQLFQDSRPLLSNKPLSRPHHLLEMCTRKNITQTIKQMVDMKFLSHSVIEGAAMQMATSASKQGHQRLQKLCDDLHFVIKRLDFYLAKKLEELCSTKNLLQVETLIDAAKSLILSIGRATMKVK